MNRQIIQEAAEWFVEMGSDEPSRETKRAFDEWLRRSPEHVQAYVEIVPIWEDGALLERRPETDPQALLALGRAAQNVSRLDGPAPAPGVRKVKRWPLGLAAAILMACLLLAIGYTLKDPVYSTSVGEQRSIVLDDGSTVELNTRTRLQVTFDERKRQVRILEGQALFNVAQDKARPFVVLSDDARIQALGTQFDVYRRPAGTTVTVVEGRVAVDSGRSSGAGAGAGTLSLSAGDQVTFVPGKALHAARANLHVATSWTQRQLVFDLTPLPEVVAEFNRYNKRPLVIEGEGLRDFHVNGVFSSTDPSSLLRFLKAEPGVLVEESSSAVRISSRE